MIIAYSDWLEFDVQPALTIDAAVPLIAIHLAD